MADRSGQLQRSRWADAVRRYAMMAVPMSIVALLGVILVPLPPVMLDVLLAANLSLSAVILLTTLHVRSALEFAVFPSLLLVTTLLRLVLNVASTRLILSADAPTPDEVTGVAGQIIEAFGHFVAGGSVVVGLIIFIILIVVQFVVITKGSTRISEVAARFTLDAMPGKQMAIDADLNAGAIDEVEARRRRAAITEESEFYGAMDGASKFVRGDAIAGVIITLINIAGGFAIGVLERGWPAGDTLGSFTRLTIGDGLVSQVPAFIIAIAAGLIITRSSSKEDLGSDLTTQLTRHPIALGITAAFLGALAFTGLPMAPMLALGGSIGALAWYLNRTVKRQASADADRDAERRAEEQGPPPADKLLPVDTMELEIGYGLVSLFDAKQGGDLLDRIGKMRRQIALDLGIVVPPIRIHDNMLLGPNDYHIKLRGNTIAQGAAYPGRFLAMDTGLLDPDAPPLDGTKTKEPAFGLDAWWIDPSQKARAETFNYTVVDASSLLAGHLTEVIKGHADELLSREETAGLIEQLKEKSPKLVEEVVPEQVKPGDLQKVLQNLLRERVPIRDLETILETLGGWAGRTKDVDVLTEYARNALRRTICGQYVKVDAETGRSRLHCVTLDPGLEDLIASHVDRSGAGTAMTMPPAAANRVTSAILGEVSKLISAGHHPLVLASPQVRAQVRQLLEPHLPNAAVMGYNEVSKGVEVESLGLVTQPAEPQAAMAE